MRIIIKQNKYQSIVQNAIYQSDAICFISEFIKNDCLIGMSPITSAPVFSSSVNSIQTISSRCCSFAPEIRVS